MNSDSEIIKRDRNEGSDIYAYMELISGPHSVDTGRCQDKVN